MIGDEPTDWETVIRLLLEPRSIENAGIDSLPRVEEMCVCYFGYLVCTSYLLCSVIMSQCSENKV